MEENKAIKIKIVAVHPKRRLFAAGFNNGIIELVRENGGIKKIEGHRGQIRALNIHPRLPLVLSAGEDLTVKVVNYQTMSSICRFEKSHDDMICSVRFLDGTTFFVTASCDNVIQIWNYQTEKRVIGFKLQVQEPVTHALVNSTKKLIATTTHGVVSWDLNEFQKLKATCGQNLTHPHQTIPYISTKPNIKPTNFPIKQLLMSKQNGNLALISKFEIVLITNDVEELCRKTESNKIMSAFWVSDEKLLYTTCKDIKFYEITGVNGTLLNCTGAGFIIQASDKNVYTTDFYNRIILELQITNITGWKNNVSEYLDQKNAQEDAPPNQTQAFGRATMADVRPMGSPNNQEQFFKGKPCKKNIGIFAADLMASRKLVKPEDAMNKKKKD